jgi:hypothetical protein
MREHRIRYVWVDTDTLAETDYAAPPGDGRPTLRVQIIDAFTEQCLTYDDRLGRAVSPPGLGWAVAGGYGMSTRWIRKRKRRTS